MAQAFSTTRFLPRFAVAFPCVFFSVACGLSVACTTAQVVPPTNGEGGLAGGGPAPIGVDNCVPDRDRLDVTSGVGVSPDSPDGPRSSPVYRFWPQGETLFRDVGVQNYVDLDPTSVIRDYFCNDFSYDGHRGLDIDIPWFEQQFIGVPVFAAVDGTVIAAVDGNTDTNTSCTGNANYVAIDDGGGWITYYYHFKKNSVAVNVGQVVRAGQQLGLTGSSGCSTNPHLHLETSSLGSTFEPFAGPCRGGESLWNPQPPVPTTLDTILVDFGVSATAPSSGVGFPYRPAVSREIKLSDPAVYFFARTYYQKPGSTWRIQFKRPAGTVAFDSGNQPFNNTDWYRSAWWWWGYNITDMHSIAGTWTVSLWFNNQKLVDAPVRVVGTLTNVNHAPQPITAEFDPTSPSPSDVVFARVFSAPGLADLDWDVVRYHYVWKVNGTVVRDFTGAGHADAIPRNSASFGDTVTCAITPSDGTADGTPITISYTFHCPADFDGNGFVNGDDFDAYVNAFVAGDAAADFNADGFVTGDDYDSYVTAFENGC